MTLPASQSTGTVLNPFLSQALSQAIGNTPDTTPVPGSYTPCCSGIPSGMASHWGEMSRTLLFMIIVLSSHSAYLDPHPLAIKIPYLAPII